jgi:hypothetical protein
MVLFSCSLATALTGRAGRLEALRTVIETALERGDVRFSTCEALAEAALDDPALIAEPLNPVTASAELYPDY